MFDYKITPKQPLIFRDGKPFGTEDNVADTLSFPLPSTIAGAMRTAWADSQNKDYTKLEDIKKIKAKSVSGPLLTHSKEGDKPELLFPIPADSVCIKPDVKPESYIYRLRPEKIGKAKDEGINGPHQQLSPVFMIQKNIKGKPAKDAPKFWNYQKMKDWIQDDNSNELVARDYGTQNLPIETRTHVSIDPKSQTAKSRHLFQTAGLDFAQQRRNKNHSEKKTERVWGWETEEYGLACQFQEEIPETYRTVGGESRLAFIQKQDDLFPQCPVELARMINEVQGFRLILLTPAIFKNGYLPDWVNDDMTANYRGMKLKLHAVSVSHWQAGSSWDMASPNSKQGKGMRSLKRLVPAGTVYWFEILAGKINTAGFWLTSISDEPSGNKNTEYRRFNDGYGLTLPGVWNIKNFTEDTK